MDMGKLSQGDKAEVDKFLALLRDRKKLRKARAAGLPCPLTPERVEEIRAHVTCEDALIDDDEGMPD